MGSLRFTDILERNIKKMRITLTCVRHGEAAHNAPKTIRTDKPPKPKYTDDGVLDTPLTPLGLEQIEKVGTRLAEAKFDLAISSDLQRARDTALAVTKHHDGLKLDTWTCTRERQFGLIEKSVEHGNRLLVCLLQVEDFIKDRSELTWRIPEGGESVVDLRERIKNQFFPKLIETAKKYLGDQGDGHCSILFADHSLFLKEMHMIFGEIANTETNFNNYHLSMANTAVSSYEIDVDSTRGIITNVSCNLYACKKHLE